MAIGKDKWMHGIACFGLVMMGTLAGIASGYSNGVYTFGFMGIIAAIIAGFGKEFWDAISVGGTGWSDADLIADFVGTALGTFVWAILVFWG